MSKTKVPPKGYRWLKSKEKLMDRDKWLCACEDCRLLPGGKSWVGTNRQGAKADDELVYIRRVKPSTKGKAK